MNRELAQTFISRAMDGELPERQRAGLEAWMAAHPEDRETADQWNFLGRLARAEAAAVKIPDEELAWQNIRRAIRNAAPEKSESRFAFFGWRLAWAAGMVAVICASAIGIGMWHGHRAAPALAMADAKRPSQIDWADTDVPGASTMVYEDEDSGLAVVWLMTDDKGDVKKNSG